MADQEDIDLTGMWVHVDILAGKGDMGKIAVTWSPGLNDAAAAEILGSAGSALGYDWDMRELDP